MRKNCKEENNNWLGAKTKLYGHVSFCLDFQQAEAKSTQATLFKYAHHTTLHYTSPFFHFIPLSFLPLFLPFTHNQPLMAAVYVFTVTIWLSVFFGLVAPGQRFIISPDIGTFKVEMNKTAGLIFLAHLGLIIAEVK